MDDPRERSNYQSEYYKKNKERLKEQRKARYQEDEEVREAANNRAKRHYWFKVRPTLIQEEQDIDRVGLEAVQPVGTLGIQVNDPEDPRHGTEVMMAVYVTEAVATLLGRTPTTVRLWEKNGIIPAPTFRARDIGASLTPGANPRLYTEDELRVFVAHRKDLRIPSKKMATSTFSKNVHAGMAELTNGVAPQR